MPRSRKILPTIRRKIDQLKLTQNDTNRIVDKDINNAVVTVFYMFKYLKKKFKHIE